MDLLGEILNLRDTQDGKSERTTARRFDLTENLCPEGIGWGSIEIRFGFVARENIESALSEELPRNQIPWHPEAALLSSRRGRFASLYSSLYGAGLVEMHKYQEALGPLDEAIKVAGKTRGAAYPTIAVNAKIDALSGLGENKEALALAAEELRRVSVYRRHTYDDKASCNRQSTAQAKLWTRQVLKNLQHGYAVKGLGIKCQVLGVHAHDTQALHSSGAHRKKVSDSSFALFDGGYREVGQAGQQWPEKRASPTAEIQKILRRKPSQHPEYSLHSGQFRIPFELVEPKPGFQSIVDSGRGVAEPASNECGRQISEIGFHRLSRIAVQSLFYSACVILSQVSSNRDRYLRRRSASFALALRVRELLKSRRPASDSERQRRQAATTCSS